MCYCERLDKLPAIQNMSHIVVTGYGPFTSSAEDKTPIHHEANASWEAVKEIMKQWKSPIQLRLIIYIHARRVLLDGLHCNQLVLVVQDQI